MHITGFQLSVNFDLVKTVKALEKMLENCTFAKKILQ